MRRTALRILALIGCSAAAMGFGITVPSYSHDVRLPFRKMILMLATGTMLSAYAFACPRPDSSEALWKAAQKAIAQGKFDAASVTLHTLVNTYPQSQYAARAQRALLDPRIIARPREHSSPFFAEARVAEPVMQKLLTRSVQPQCPGDANADDTLVLWVLIGSDGVPTHIRVESGHPLLVGAAIAAVKEWRWNPYLLDRVPTEVETQLHIHMVCRSSTVPPEPPLR